MPSHLHRLEPPGEDTFDLPAGLAWFVALCTWLRRHLRERYGGNPIALERFPPLEESRHVPQVGCRMPLRPGGVPLDVPQNVSKLLHSTRLVPSDGLSHP